MPLREKAVFVPLPADAREIYLQPGEWFWGSGKIRIKTLLGSCLAITAWHPQKQQGGMTHCLLPSRSDLPQSFSTVSDADLSGKYVDEALEIFFRAMAKTGTMPQQYVFKVFGGGKMFDFNDKSGSTIGDRNLQKAHEILSKMGVSITAEHAGGSGHRHVIFDLWSGDCWVRHEGLP
ncbi:MAG: chemotaxis protein CheD [Turneriella sp.]|nr:chemotaxis protein CheD [Turneriella sp.]